MLGDELQKKLEEVILNYDEKGAKELATECVKNGEDLLDCISALTTGIKKVGEGFGKGDLFLPSLIGAANALEAAMPILNNALREQGKESTSRKKVVLGTVFGDVHSIGKNMVGTLLTAEGFKVIDLGINIKADKFIETVKRENADLLALSALLTTTMVEQERIINLLKSSGVKNKVKVIVGGGPVTQEYATSIGADGYEGTATGAVKLVKRILSK